jgi:choice-of-anchor C domain-containing protein
MKLRYLGLVAALALPSTAQAAAFINGDFESGPNVGSSFMAIGATSTLIKGWTVVSGSVDYKGGYWQAGSGGHSVDLNGFSTGALSQTFDTVAGLSYIVEFLLAGNPDGGPTLKTLNVGATGNALASYDFSTVGNSRTSMGWEGRSYAFTAIGNSTTLTFTSTTGGNLFGPVIDAVTLSVAAPVPEPAIWAMMVVGIAAVGVTMRRSRSTVSFA